jgi:NAD(P)-dependent dehydrogenase (short-subunit alcohol dehydrogenase family)
MELEGQVALVTGGGRGIGADIARELAAAGMRVAVSARTAEQVAEVASNVDGLALTGDVSKSEDAERMVAETVRTLGPLDLLVNNAGIASWEENAWEREAEKWWHVFEVNVLGAYLLCRTVIPSMLERGGGRIVNVASGAAYLPGSTSTAYSASKAALNRFSETLAAQLAGRGVAVFPISPGLVRTEMTIGSFPEDAPWTPPECAPQLVRALATGEFDRLSGRYLHAEHDPPEQLRDRIDEILADDLNALRLRR